MLTKINNKQGLTLIEVLASIVLLSIVIISFISILPQMTSMNNKTEENLQAANVGKELLVKMKTLTYDSIKNGQNLPLSTITLQESEKKYNIKGNYLGFHVELEIDKIIDSPSNFHKIKIEIYENDNANSLTQTYGYITK